MSKRSKSFGGKMGYKGFATRRDNSEKEMLPILKQRGIQFETLDHLALPDVMTADVLIEFKTGKAKLKDRQRAFHDEWSGYCEVIRTQDDLDRVLGLGRHEGCRESMIRLSYRIAFRAIALMLALEEMKPVRDYLEALVDLHSTKKRKLRFEVTPVIRSELARIQQWFGKRDDLWDRFAYAVIEGRVKIPALAHENRAAEIRVAISNLKHLLDIQADYRAKEKVLLNKIDDLWAVIDIESDFYTGEY